MTAPWVWSLCVRELWHDGSSVAFLQLSSPVGASLALCPGGLICGEGVRQAHQNPENTQTRATQI